MENNNNSKSMAVKALATGFVAGVIAATMCSRKMRRNSCQWADEMRGDVMRQVLEAKDITQEKYNQIIDEIRLKYEAMKNVGAKEMKELIDELKSHWQNIAQEEKKQMSNAENLVQEEKTASAATK